MSTAAANIVNGRRRRSPRLPQVVAVEIAGRGTDGKVLVESTSTCEISRHGASLTARSPFPIGTPMAIRRPGAKPVRARVISALPGPEPGVQKVGVEFLTEETYWDFEFPQDWQDSYAPPLAEKIPPAAVREIAGDLDTGLEAAIRKAEAVRQQAENLLAESAAQIDAARSQAAAALAPQLEALAARQRSLQEELAVQARIAGEAIRTQQESARDLLGRRESELQQKAADLGRQIENAIQTGLEKFQKAMALESQRASEVATRAAAELDAHRKALTDQEAQVARWREENTAGLEKARRESERLSQNTRDEMRAAATASVQEFRKRLPELQEEASRSFASALAEQKAAVNQWIAQSLEGARARLAELENNCRGSLAEHARQALEQYSALFDERWREARSVGDAITQALEARLERSRNALRELADWSDRTTSAIREKLETAGAEAETRFREAASRQAAQLNEVAAQIVERLQQKGESLDGMALEATHRLEQSAGALQELSVLLDRNAKQKREELDALFASLLERYDHRKRALDRLLETLEQGRAVLRSDLDSLRTCTEENQARLSRFTAEQEAALKSKALELAQQLQAAVLALESGLEERAREALESLGGAFIAGLEQATAQGRQRFHQALDTEIDRAGARLAELTSALDHHADEHARALASAAAEHILRLDQERQDAEARAAAATESLAQRAADAQAALDQATADAVSAVEDRRAKAETSAAESLASIQQARGAAAKESSDLDNQARQRRQSLETQFSSLASRLEEKRASLDAFSGYMDQAKAEMTQAVASLDRQVEEARATLHLAQHEIQEVLDKRGEALAVQLRQKLEEFLNVCQRKLEAEGEAAHGVFQVRLRAMTEQALDTASKLMGQAGDACAAGLTRATENLRRDQERRIEELAQQSEETFREQRRMLQEAAAATTGFLNEQLQQMTRLAVERVREAHELVLREIPARVAEGERAFRQSLEKIVEQAGEEAAASLAAFCSQWLARSEMEIRRRIYEVMQNPASPTTKNDHEAT